MQDTPKAPGHTAAASVPGFSAFIVALLVPAAPSAAQPRPVEAAVVWVGERRAYVAPRDSAALQAGDLLTFVLRGKAIAAGTVERLHDGELAVATLTWGSLRGVTRLDRLRVLGERPAVRALPLLRIGFPSGRRSNLIFVCEAPTLGVPVPDYADRSPPPSENAFRLVRDARVPAHPPWPDTLLIRLFDEAADEEIALQRGELDAAVFWPGELSAHLRDDPRWSGGLRGRRVRGVVAALWPETGEPGGPGSAGPASSGLEALNQQLFRGDLAAWEPTVGPPPPDPGRFVVDSSWPGQGFVEAFLNRGREGRSPPPAGVATYLLYLDSPVAARDSLILALADYVRTGPFPPHRRARADSLAAEVRRSDVAGPASDPDRFERCLRELRVTPLFTIACPLLYGPELRPYLSALGPDSLVNLLQCAPAGRRP